MQSVILNRIYNRINHLDRNHLGLICGETGTGKSLSAISIAASIDPNFTVAKNVVFTPREFFLRLNNREPGERLEPGASLVFDESGVNLDARAWQSVQNRLLNHVFETVRSRNLIVLLTTPNLSYIDVVIRKLLHSYAETIRIDRTKKLCCLKWFELQFNGRTNEFYFKYPFKKLENGNVIQIRKLWIKKPSANIVAEYEEKKRKFVEQLNLDAERAINALDDRSRAVKPVQLSLTDVVARIKADDVYIKTAKDGTKSVKTALVMARLEVSEIMAKKAKSLIELDLNTA